MDNKRAISIDEALSVLAKYQDEGIPAAEAEQILRQSINSLASSKKRYQKEQSVNRLGNLCLMLKRFQHPMFPDAALRGEEICKAERVYRDRFGEFLDRSSWKLALIREIEHLDLLDEGNRKMIVRDWLLGSDWPTISGLLHLRRIKDLVPTGIPAKMKEPKKRSKPKDGTQEAAILGIYQGQALPGKLTKSDNAKLKKQFPNSPPDSFRTALRRLKSTD